MQLVKTLLLSILAVHFVEVLSQRGDNSTTAAVFSPIVLLSNDPSFQF